MATLAIDIGNRRAKLAIVSVEDEIVHRMHFPTSELQNNAEVIVKIANDPRVNGITMGSSVPHAVKAVKELLSDYPLLVVSGETPSEITVEYEPKLSLGPDRLAAAVGAYHVYGKALKRAIMIVDAGTAVTADLISEGGIFVGGAILPGDGLAFECLASGTANLEKIEYYPTEAYIGACTEECMLVGIRSAVVGAIEHLYKRYCDFHREHPFMLLTGASAAWIAPELAVPHMVDPDIVLVGLAAIWTYNNGKIINDKTSRTI
ncbi:type III pantothenate kinase [bacterium]|nr:type III pantothenate kinase [bacterium]